jgi:murein DD-endopeptidase MepM/ murein hydrolase activator NlpD
MRTSRGFGVAAPGGWLAAIVALAVIVWTFSIAALAPNATDLPPPGRSRATSSIRSSNGTAHIEADPVRELRSRQLDLPVRGAVRRDLHDSFSDSRRWFHSQEAIDIMAPRNTPILAVEDGTIARLFESKAGGTTVYQFDPTNRYAYYYAHLERYADGLHEGNHVQRGQVLGYVGTSGNAPAGTPHLHFAIFRLTDKKQWWQGTPINPYEILK